MDLKEEVTEINRKVDLILELIHPLVVLPRIVRSMDERLQKMEADGEMFRKVFASHSGKLNNHERRITNLESSD